MFLVCLRKWFQHCYSRLWCCSSVSLEVCSVEKMKITHVGNREFPFLHSTRAERCLHLCHTPCEGQFVCKLDQSGPATQDQAQLCRMIPSSPELLSWSRAASGCLPWKQTNTFTVSAYSLVENCVWAWCLCCSYHHLLSTEGWSELKACFLPWWMYPRHGIAHCFGHTTTTDIGNSQKQHLHSSLCCW